MNNEIPTSYPILPILLHMRRQSHLMSLVEAITNVARTGRSGDGKVFVAPLAAAVRIRTGETGAEAV